MAEQQDHVDIEFGQQFAQVMRPPFQRGAIVDRSQRIEHEVAAVEVDLVHLGARRVQQFRQAPEQRTDRPL
jgi:hypothetical protein